MRDALTGVGGSFLTVGYEELCECFDVVIILE